MSQALNATTIDFDDEKLVSIYPKASPGRSNQTDPQALRLRLNGLLQTTLDTFELFSLFFAEVRKAVPFDALTYNHEAQGIRLNLGQGGSHSCAYRLFTRDEYLGELIFKRHSRFEAHEHQLVEAVIAGLIHPLRNTLKYQQVVQSALTDTVTHTGNRVSLEKTLEGELERARRYGQRLSVLMVDLDHFKAINDEFGHAAGDLVLKDVADAIKDTVRCADRVFRYGGEEFVILLNHTDLEGGQVMAERLRLQVESLTCRHDESDIQVTLSVGAAELDRSDSQESLLDRADRALYQAKHDGRNCIRSTTEGQGAVQL